MFFCKYGMADKFFMEGVVVSVGYADIAAHTLPSMKHQFDKLVVVTDPRDRWTARLCEFHGITCVKTEAFYENGDKFNKGKGINEGLKHLSKAGWVVQLDADIYLPPMTRQILNRLELDPQTIYSIDRMMCPSYEEWQRYVTNPKLIHEAYIYVHPTAFPMGVRIAEYMGKGYEPIGYFQMWNPMHSGVYEYPTTHGTADRTDVLHAKKFPRIKRQLIPELLCIHLDSEGLEVNQMGKNWNGRKTVPFTIDYALGNKGYGPGFWMMIWLILLDFWKSVKCSADRTWRSILRVLGFRI